MRVPCLPRPVPRRGLQAQRGQAQGSAAWLMDSEPGPAQTAWLRPCLRRLCPAAHPAAPIQASPAPPRPRAPLPPGSQPPSKSALAPAPWAQMQAPGSARCTARAGKSLWPMNTSFRLRRRRELQRQLPQRQGWAGAKAGEVGTVFGVPRGSGGLGRPQQGGDPTAGAVVLMGQLPRPLGLEGAPEFVCRDWGRLQRSEQGTHSTKKLDILFFFNLRKKGKYIKQNSTVWRWDSGCRVPRDRHRLNKSGYLTSLPWCLILRL